MPTPRVKICGLRDAGHARAAALSGADYLGFNFVEGVSRQLDPARGVSIIGTFRTMLSEDSMPGPSVVGLFRDQPEEFVNRVARAAGLDMVQLCGSEDQRYFARIEAPILCQVRVRPGDTPEDVEKAVAPHLAAGRMVVLDTYSPHTPGGTGETFDWAAAGKVAAREGVLIAGGLTPDNVAEAIARLGAWGVDVSSGVETDGVKDETKIHNFITNALGT